MTLTLEDVLKKLGKSELPSSIHDIHIVPNTKIDRLSEDDVKPWVCMYSSGSFTDFNTLNEAISYQAQYRAITGLDVFTGKPLDPYVFRSGKISVGELLKAWKKEGKPDWLVTLPCGEPTTAANLAAGLHN